MWSWKCFCSYPLTTGLGVICFHVKILISFWKIRPSLAMQIKRVSVLRQSKLQKSFPTEKITCPDSQVLHACNAWFCPEHCSSEDFRRGYSVRTSKRKLSGKSVVSYGNLLFCPLSTAATQPLYLYCQHTAHVCFSHLQHLTEGTHQKWWCISHWAEKMNWLHKEKLNVGRNVGTY